MTDLLAAADRVQAAATRPGPTRELGDALDHRHGTFLAPDDEYVPDLQWPLSRDVYQRMRSDPQVQALLSAITLPIRRYTWSVDPQDARPEVAARVAEDLGLPLVGQDPVRRRRSRGRFSHDDHLRHALLALVYGHMYFQQVGGYPDGTTGPWRLRKLRPEMPATIDRILVADDGGLDGIEKLGPNGLLEIPVDVLVAYVWDREGANWAGRSLLRSMYQPWFIKQELLEIDLLKNRRNGVGVPVARETERDVDPQARREGLEMASAWRAGRDAGVSMPFGMDVDLKAVVGQLPDTLASIRNANEEMARAGLASFLMLGQAEAGGSYALGGQLVDFFALALDTIAGWYAEVTTEHVIEDWVDYNHGEDEPAPKLVYERRETPELTVSDLGDLVDSGALVVDDEFRGWVRDRFRLPAAATVPAPNPPAVPPASPAPVRAAAGDAPDPLDVDALRAALDDAEAAAQAAWDAERAAAIDDLVAQVEAAQGDPEALAALTVPAVDATSVAAALEPLVATGVQSVRTEAEAQGVTLPAAALAAADAAADIAAGATALAARALALSAASVAVASAGAADQVREHLDGLEGAAAGYELAGAAARALNTGRFSQLDEAPAGTRWYSSELLDAATCTRCRDVDGSEYASMTDVRGDYPVGGYVGCEGRNRCRGTAVAVYREDA